jgi:DNA-binding transcriptional ArsR family regulator
MLELQFGSVGVQRVRFAISPAEELLAAVRTAAVPARQPLHRAWSIGASATLASLEVDELVGTVSGTDYFPDFLSPPPTGSTTTFEEQMERLVRTPARQVEKELALAFSGRERPPGLSGRPSRARDLLADQFQRCWGALLAPIWSRVSDLLRADIEYRARLYAAGGVEAVLSRLHRSVHFEPDRLLLDSYHPRPQRQLDARGLLLVPRVLGWGGVGPMLLAPWPPALIYPARGRSTVWREARPEASALARAFGRTKARLLTAMDQAATTTALARRLSMSPGSVSAHLKDLQVAGLLTTTRHGRGVFYSRTDVGNAVCTAARTER